MAARGVASAAAYDPVPQGDDTRDERGHLLAREGDPASVSDGVALTGVEASQAWSHMTKQEKLGLRLTFGVLGAAVLLPFNALITPSEFYRTLLKGTSHEKDIMSWIIVVYNVACIVFGAHATTTMHKTSMRGRITSSLWLIAATLVVTVCCSAFIIPRPEVRDAGLPYAFPAILLITLMLATATSYLQLAVVTLANAYGPTSMTAMLSGQGMVGALASMAQLFTTIFGSVVEGIAPDPNTVTEALAATMFYGMAANTVMVCIFCFRHLTTRAVYTEMQAGMGLDKTTSPSQPAQASISARPVVGLARYMSPSVHHQCERVMRVQRYVVMGCFSIAYIFTVTLAVFPALTSRVRPESTSPSQSQTLIFVAAHFVAFNAGDFVGRTLPGFLPKRLCLGSMHLIALLTLARTVFVPLLSACNVDGKSTGAHLGSIVFFALVILLGITNGFLATSAFIVGPTSSRAVQAPEDRALAAGLMSWWLTIGLALGSLLSFVVGGA